MGGKLLQKGNSDNHQPKLFAVVKGLDLTPFKTIRIAVSGDVILNELEISIIDTPEFQRLRSIKQLGTTYLVYPTALHTRFDHSLGTLAMAARIIREIRDNKHNSPEESLISPEEEQLIRLFALLHDITHIPFGHTLEDEFNVLQAHDSDENRYEHFLGRDSRIGRIIIGSLEDDLYTRLLRIMTIDKENLETLSDDLFIYDIVNNTVCADLLDYIRRDCYFCNIVLDVDYRFLKYLYLGYQGASRRLVVRLWKTAKVMPRKDILSELVRLLDTRYLLGQRVYFHHAKLLTGAMVAGSLQRALDQDQIRIEFLYQIGDESLLDRLESCASPNVSKLILNLRARRIWKRVFLRNRRSFEAEQETVGDLDIWKVIEEEWWKDAKGRASEEDRLSCLIGLEPADILISCPDQEMAMKMANMKVFWNGEIRPLNQCSGDPITADRLDVILRSHKDLWGVRGFLNPAHMENKNIVKNSLNYLFTFDKETRIRRRENFYGEIVEKAVAAEDLASNMQHGEFTERSQGAVQRLMSETMAIRDHEMVLRIVRDAFTQ